MLRASISIAVCAAGFLLGGSIARAQQAPEAAEGAALAKKLYDSATHDVFRPGRATPKETGEDLCWRARYSGSIFLRGYRAYGSAAFIDYGLKFYDALADAMDTGPDGYKGFIGPYDYDPRYWCDVHVGDALIFHGMLELAETVRNDPALKAKYADRVARYTALAEKDFYEKWNARDTYREDGPFGMYIFWNQYCKPNDLKHWQVVPDERNSSDSLPYNQVNEMAVVFMELYRVTGKAMYRERAAKIFATMKSRLQFFADHYCWNYWEPLGPWDIDLAKGATRAWVSTHPYSNYQSGETAQITAAYEGGIVFDETDMHRFINTNLKVMWNGDLKNPQFRNSDATVLGYRPPGLNKDHPHAAGCLWDALDVFDPTIRQLEGESFKASDDPGDIIQRAYFDNVVKKEPVTFKRQNTTDAPKVFDFPFSECKGLIAASVLPSQIKPGAKAILFCQSKASGDVEIALCSADGKTQLASLYHGRIKGDDEHGTGQVIQQWDGMDPANKTSLAGDYRVRWTFAGGHRDFPIHIGK